MSDQQQVKTLERAAPSTTGGPRPRHIVENVNPDRSYVPGVTDAPPFKPAQLTLCGELWDRLGVQHNGAICQACVDEQRRRHAG